MREIQRERREPLKMRMTLAIFCYRLFVHRFIDITLKCNHNILIRGMYQQGAVDTK